MRWTYGPGCTRDPWGLPSWTEGFLVPRAQPGSSLSQLLDLTLGSSVSWPSTHDGGDAEAPPGPQGVGSGVFSNKRGANLTQSS